MADTATPAPTQPVEDVSTSGDDFADLGAALVEELTTNPDSSTEDTKESPAEETTTEEEVAEETKDVKEDAEKPEEKSTEQPDETKESEEEAAKQKGAEARKEQLNREIRELVARRNQERQMTEQAIAQRYRTETAAELVAGGMDAQAAEIEAQRQQLELQQYSTQIADLNNDLNTQSVQVMADFPIFDPESPSYDADLAQRANAVYMATAGLQTDPQTGLVTYANVLPYDIYKAFAESAQLVSQRATVKGQVEGQRAAEKMAAAVEPAASAPIREQADETEDAFLKGFNSV